MKQQRFTQGQRVTKTVISVGKYAWTADGRIISDPAKTEMVLVNWTHGGVSREHVNALRHVEEVAPAEGCPNCGEQRMDWLVWDDDCEAVTCQTCGTVYTPTVLAEKS